MAPIDRFAEEILKDRPRLAGSDTFRFSCHRGLECFNRCCHDVNVFLTPYDIIRLKQRLGLASGQFLDRYTLLPFSKNQRYPVLMIKMAEDEARACPFLREPEGCSVYEDRPWACRMFPIGRAAPPDDAAESAPFFFRIEDPICLGGTEAREWTVGQWLADQGVADYDRLSRGFQSVVQRAPSEQELSAEQMDMLFMVCYDLDRFRRFVFESRFLEKFDIAQSTVEAIRADDVALMEFGFEWLRFCLWHEPTIKIRPEVAEAKRKEAGM